MFSFFSHFGQALGWRPGSPRWEKDAGRTWVLPLPIWHCPPTPMGPWALIPTCKYSTNFEKLSYPHPLTTSGKSPASPYPVSTSLSDLLALVNEAL